MREPAPYAIFLRLLDRPCLVIGGGHVAAAKVVPLLAAGARVRVVALEIAPAVRALAAQEAASGGAARLQLREGAFEECDLDGIWLVIAATSNAELNRRIHALCGERGILVNVVDAPELCSFYVPSVLRRGDLQIATSTNGRSPLLAAWIRRRLESLFPPAWERYLEWLGDARRELRGRGNRNGSPAERGAALRGLINDESLELLFAGREAEFRVRWERWSAASRG